jgi:hypothetical protein
MRWTLTTLACVTGLSACSFEITGADLFSCEPRESVPRSEIEIGPIPGGVAALAVGDALQLNAQVRPLVSGTPDTETGACHPLYGDPVPTLILWSSTEPDIATVSNTGLVRARAPGDAMIRAQAPFRFVSTSLIIRVSVKGTGNP